MSDSISFGPTYPGRVTISRDIRQRFPVAVDALSTFLDAYKISLTHASIHDSLLHSFYLKHPLIRDSMPQPILSIEELLPRARLFTIAAIHETNLPTATAALMLTRYVALQPWEDIAVTSCYDIRHVHRLHHAACTRINHRLTRLYTREKKAGLTNDCVRASRAREIPFQDSQGLSNPDH
ncbi:MAG: hypothetical protein GX625_15180 [Clostridiaceae bacterium]|nr:hypothetical protein [Clostridiaceae bacterium]